MYVKLKKYSQNFLIDKNIIDKIISIIKYINLKILEIGPGDGKLSADILKKKPLKFDLVEIDKDLIKILKKKFNDYENIKIINEDILKHKLRMRYDLVISNLPYNISSQVLIKLILSKIAPDKMILMFQKEFANKVLENKLNSLNSIIYCFYDVKLMFNISRNCFKPVPKVESTILKFKKLNRFLLKRNEIENFIAFKRYIFSHKRKKLGNLLKKYKDKDIPKLDMRAENLS